ncbi:MAG: phosphoribosyl-ATP diphosphatase [Coriobacteriales bacterium]|nr:phosphoribosyl-ATP diphosphatase [Coriobacteriales bacterium]MBQ6585986.1 phosphoribosyl-ATP diphosphatase [Coriobacteriales bacterium]
MSKPAEMGNIGMTIDCLSETIHNRREVDPSESYTARLLGDENLALKKIAEEAGEVIMAAKDQDHDQLRYEAADLIYHLLVVLEKYGVTVPELADELNRRMK